MTAERKYKMVTPHSDENPELDPDNNSGGPLAAYSTEGTAVSELYTKERDPFHYRPKAGETVIDETIYIPDEN
jgi:hypothetical protein